MLGKDLSVVLLKEYLSLQLLLLDKLARIHLHFGLTCNNLGCLVSLVAAADEEGRLIVGIGSSV